MYNPYSLENKTILITGASSGIGRATAVECSKLGAKVVITARNEDRLKETFNMLDGDGHSIIVADLTNEDDVKSLATQCPPLDGVVSNAGVSISKPITFYAQKDIDLVFGANTFAPMCLNRWLLKKKKINNNGSIVFTSSAAAFLSTIANGIYGTSKAALTSYMKYCAKELATKRIRANAIHPGMVETGLIHGGAISEENLEAEKMNYPLGRFGKPEEIAWAIIYLLSDASAWVTGASIVIDGGVLLH